MSVLKELRTVMKMLSVLTHLNPTSAHAIQDMKAMVLDVQVRKIENK